LNFEPEGAVNIVEFINGQPDISVATATVTVVVEGVWLVVVGGVDDEDDADDTAAVVVDCGEAELYYGQC
jgi:hypothetical protein